MQDLETIKKLIEAELEPILAGLEAELVEIIIKKTSKGLHLQILADKKQGISVDDCAAINRQLGDILDQKSIIEEQYVIEVSSPGLDRQLKTKRDFERVAGNDVEIWLSIVVANNTFYTGKVKSAGADSVTITTKGAKDIDIPYSSINKARMALENVKD